MSVHEMTRRETLRAAIALSVAFATRDLAAQTSPVTPPTVPVEGLLVIDREGRCSILTSKTEFGQGIRTAFIQIVADELDIPFERISVGEIDTDRAPDQGITGGSFSLQIIGPLLRRAAATARRALVELAAQRLGVEAGALEAVDGTVRVRSGAPRSVSYAELLNGRTLSMAVDNKVALKPRESYRHVGKSVPRVDIPAKILGGQEFIHNLRMAGMLHARVIHPGNAGAQVAEIDSAALPSDIKVIRKGNFVAVVATTEWDAISASRTIAIRWSSASPLPPMDETFDTARRAPVERDDKTADKGDPAGAIAAAAAKIDATYTFDIQTHGAIGPSCAVAQYEEGKLTVWSGGQAPFDLKMQLADMFGLAPAAVRIRYRHNAACYGRNGMEDAASEAALLAIELAPRPVRVQWMRHDEHGCEPKGPPILVDMQGGLDSAGKIVAWKSESWVPTHGRNIVPTTASVATGKPDGATMGAGNLHQNSNPPYTIPNVRTLAHRVTKTPFRPSWIRSPGRLQNCFAVESFMDELAAAGGQDPVQFRLSHMANDRGREVIAEAARMSGWETRSSPDRRTAGPIRHGRGIAYIHYDSNRTHVAGVASVEVDTASGAVHVRDFWIAHDCGEVINPDGVRLQIEGNVIQTLSRTLKERIAWDENGITTLDWAAYPILNFREVPRIAISLIDRPAAPPWGAGEPSACIVPAAVANAVFDATGCRLRAAPFLPSRVRSALSAT